MGVVYISREGREDRFTIGAAKSMKERKKGGYTRYNPNLKLYRQLTTPDHFALEKFLHNELAERRILEIDSDSWYSVTSSEVDIAIEKARTLGAEFIERKNLVANVKNKRSDGTWIEPNERIKELHRKLSYLSLAKQRLCQDESVLKMEVMAFIGEAEGVDGLFEWPSHEERKFQTKLFAAEYPELYEQFRKSSYVRRLKLWGGVEDSCEETED